MRQFRSGVSGPKADVENVLVRHSERPVVAVSRRLGDEIHPWLPNGDLRPILVSRDLIVERPLRSSSGRLTYGYSSSRANNFDPSFRADERLSDPSRVPETPFATRPLHCDITTARSRAKIWERARRQGAQLGNFRSRTKSRIYSGLS